MARDDMRCVLCGAVCDRLHRPLGNRSWRYYECRDCGKVHCVPRDLSKEVFVVECAGRLSAGAAREIQRTWEVATKGTVLEGARLLVLTEGLRMGQQGVEEALDGVLDELKRLREAVEAMVREDAGEDACAPRGEREHG